ncbi:RDD family protein [Methylocystis parvus]|uniref:RDD family protein n=1 Tax=Methylocystis parvus TaxID=134 RepID=A0A6B8MB28_9HYPH|nr:RDD family protein [Methylocystis parvus]QGM98483.1 RDD family protein [Methylocystis parvus]WBK01180.1 RDD family protein [Methylocystis parvus OBBP]
MSDLATQDEGRTAHPLDAKFYVRQGDEIIGPISGFGLVKMIETGTAEAQTSVMKLGEDWTELAKIPLFASCFPPDLVITPAAPRQEQARDEYVGFFPRLGAYLVDYLVMSAIVFVVAVVFGVTLALATGSAEDPLSDQAWRIVGTVIGLIVGVLYYGYFTSGSWQATPGKRALGIYVIRTDGRRIGWGLAAGRYLAYFLSSIPLFYGFLMILWTDEHKGLHDIACKTRVVKGRPTGS